jgi:hypothetical protein
MCVPRILSNLTELSIILLSVEHGFFCGVAAQDSFFFADFDLDGADPRLEDSGETVIE